MVGELKANWDTQGAPPITEEAKRTARMLIGNPPFVVPCSDGGIQLEWHRDGVDYEVVIGPDGKQNHE